MREDRITQRTVTVVMSVIAALAFVFSFGNVWALAVRLEVPRPVAPLIAPMVDLSVVGLLVGLRYLSLRGIPASELKAATRLMHLCGLLTLALNVAEPVIARHYGRAAVDTVAPLLLLGWGQVGPQLLRHFHTVTRPQPLDAFAPADVPAGAAETDPGLEPTPAPAPAPAPPPAAVSRTAPTSATTTPAVPDRLLDAARRIADAHQAEHGEPITAMQLKARLGVTLPIATAAHMALAD